LTYSQHRPVSGLCVKSCIVLVYTASCCSTQTNLRAVIFISFSVYSLSLYNLYGGLLLRLQPQGVAGYDFKGRKLTVQLNTNFVVFNHDSLLKTTPRLNFKASSCHRTKTVMIASNKSSNALILNRIKLRLPGYGIVAWKDAQIPKFPSHPTSRTYARFSANEYPILIN
jgi:hypothetical protein